MIKYVNQHQRAKLYKLYMTGKYNKCKTDSEWKSEQSQKTTINQQHGE